MILLIIACSLIGSVLLIGVCAPLSTVIPPTPPKDNTTSIVMEELFREDLSTDANSEYSVPGESAGENAIRDDLREWIARSSIPTLRSHGMTDEEIKSELLRDLALTEEQVDEILAAQIEESIQNGVEFNANNEVIESDERTGKDMNSNGSESGDSIGKNTIKGDLRKWIASSSVPIPRSRGMTNEEIRSELLRDSSLTEEQVDEILAAQ